MIRDYLILELEECPLFRGVSYFVSISERPLSEVLLYMQKVKLCIIYSYVCNQQNAVVLMVEVLLTSLLHGL